MRVIIDILGDEETVVEDSTAATKDVKRDERPLVTDLVDLQLEIVLPSKHPV